MSVRVRGDLVVTVTMGPLIRFKKGLYSSLSIPLFPSHNSSPVFLQSISLVRDRVDLEDHFLMSLSRGDL